MTALSDTLAQFTGGRAAEAAIDGVKDAAGAHEFVALPSARRPRWLLPTCDAGGARAGLQIYTPYTPLARLLKGVTLACLRAGWRGRRRNRIRVTAPGPLPLDRLVTEVTGERRPLFALALGTGGRFRKLTAQVMRPDGEILGYIKFPLSAVAGRRIRHEAAMLEALGRHAALRPHLPRVLHAGPWETGGEAGQENGYILFQSAGPAGAGAARLGAAHEAFLQRLAAARGEEIAGEEIVERTAARWRATAPGVSSEWRALGDEALRRAHVELRGGRVACGIAHGDFAPWNTRDAGSERLFVYDWEAAAWEAPLGWDMFHFQVQVASLLGGRAWRPPARRERALFWLYLLDSACLGIAEQSAACRGVEFRRQLLRAELSHP